MWLVVVHFSCPMISSVPHYCTVFTFHWLSQFVLKTERFRYVSVENHMWKYGQEGFFHALTPSCENTRITASCWTVIDRKTLELTKKDTPHPKTKEKPRWDGRRGAITVKSKPITAGWVTHRLENTYTTEVHPLEWRFWASRQDSQPGGLATGGGIPRESDFEG